LQPRGEEGERLDEPLDLRVGALVVSKLKPLGDARVGARELAAHPA
jgi:hypothetical protein